jgi:hypothetical protein
MIVQTLRLENAFEIFLFFSLLQINMFFIFSEHFDVLMLKIIFKILKFDFDGKPLPSGQISVI